jgi:hypothetical protein
MVDGGTILEAIEQHRDDLKKAAKALINAANRVGGEDNITVIFFEVAAEERQDIADTARRPVIESESTADEDTLDESHAQPAVEVAEPKHRSRLLPVLAALAVLLMIAAAVLWLLENL